MTRAEVLKLMPNASESTIRANLISHGPELLKCKRNVVSKTGTSHECDSTMGKNGGSGAVLRESVPVEAATNF